MRRALVLALALAACSDDLEAGAPDVDAGPEDDPLLQLVDDPDPGSLEEIQRAVISQRCSGQPGLCHNGQFEPNLSTTANTYAYLVARPAIENTGKMRVAPGDPDASFIIDKLRNRNVLTQMPLGAEPLADDEIAMIEDWIDGGARRSPAADEPELLNNPPLPPEIGVFNGTARLDSAGSFNVPRNVPLTFRHSVSDFETVDSAIPFGIVILQRTSDSMQLVVNPASQDPANGVTSFDAAGPMGAGDLLNFRFTFTIPNTITLRNQDTGAEQSVTAAGQQFTMIVLYLDAAPPGGILTFTVGTATMVVQ